jgi:hypothetical protein
MLMELLPNIGEVYSLLVSQERQSLLNLDGSKILVASNSQSSSRGSPSQRVY